jgi:hypothetical protein
MLVDNGHCVEREGGANLDARNMNSNNAAQVFRMVSCMAMPGFVIMLVAGRQSTPRTSPRVLSVTARIEVPRYLHLLGVRLSTRILPANSDLQETRPGTRPLLQ